MKHFTEFLFRVTLFLFPAIGARSGRIWLSLLFLLASNLFVLAGIYIYNWSIANLLLLYWIENAVIGLFNVPRIILAGFYDVDGKLIWLFGIGSVFLATFFIIHYGIFWFVHGVFLIVATAGIANEGSLDQVFAAVPLTVLLPGIVAICISHLASFIIHFLIPRSFHKATSTKQMMRPYSRVMILHVTIIASYFMMAMIGFERAGLMVWVMIKIIIDMFVHMRLHAKNEQESQLAAE